MLEGFYRIGQASKQLGISSYQLRRLCQAGALDAELTSGNQWKIPISEISRLQQEGVPPIPQRLSEQEQQTPSLPIPQERRTRLPEGLYAEPSDGVIDAAEEVAITENRLRKRRLERELEEEEDFFRARNERAAAQQAADQDAARQTQLRQHRQEWENEWLTHALKCVPNGVPRELELDVHAQVSSVLTALQPNQPEYAVRRVVEAAVEKALVPWRRQAQRKRAIEAAISSLPFQIRSHRDFVEQKHATARIVANAVEQVPSDASYEFLEASAKAAIAPIVRSFEHAQLSEQVAAWSFVRGANAREDAEAKDVVRIALAKLPIGSSRAQMERARDEALVPLLVKISERGRAEVAQADEQRRRQTVEWRVESQLGYIDDYLKEAYTYEDDYGGIYERFDDARRLKEPIRNALIEECMADPQMDQEDIRSRIEELVDDLV